MPTSHTTPQSKLQITIKDLNVKIRTVKESEESTEEYFYNLGIGRNFLTENQNSGFTGEKRTDLFA